MSLTWVWHGVTAQHNVPIFWTRIPLSKLWLKMNITMLIEHGAQHFSYPWQDLEKLWLLIHMIAIVLCLYNNIQNLMIGLQQYDQRRILLQSALWSKFRNTWSQNRENICKSMMTFAAEWVYIYISCIQLW